MPAAFRAPAPGAYSKSCPARSEDDACQHDGHQNPRPELRPAAGRERLRRSAGHPDHRFDRGGPAGCIEFSDEAIAAPRERFDIPGPLGGVAQRIPQPFHSGVDTVIELDDHAVRPKALPDVFACHDLAGGFQEHMQDLERLLLESNGLRSLAQFPGAQVELKRAKSHLCRAPPLFPV